MELVHKQLEAERARIPRASPYPYTTDYPVVRNLISLPLISTMMHKTRAFPVGKSGEA